LGLVRPTAGHAVVLGATAVHTVLSRIGAVIDAPGCYPYLTGRQTLARFDAADRGADPATRAARVDAALDRLGLLSAGGRRAGAGPVRELLGALPSHLLVETPDRDAAAGVLAGFGLGPPSWDGTRARCLLGGQRVEEVCAALVGAGVRVRGLVVEPPTLED